MMNHNWERIYYETHAKLSLIDLLPDRFSDTLAIRDKPDLQDPYKEVGVEVTRAMFRDAGKQTGLLNIMNDDSGESDNSEALQADISVCLEQPFNSSAIVYTKRAVKISDQELLRSFRKKILKLNNDDFQKYTENDLYIFSPMFQIFQPRNMERFAEKTAHIQSDFEYRFNHVFVNDFASFFVCDLHSGNVSVIRISEEKQQVYCLGAKERADRITEQLNKANNSGF